MTICSGLAVVCANQVKLCSVCRCPCFLRMCFRLFLPFRPLPPPWASRRAHELNYPWPCPLPMDRLCFATAWGGFCPSHAYLASGHSASWGHFLTTCNCRAQRTHRKCWAARLFPSCTSMLLGASAQSGLLRPKQKPYAPFPCRNKVASSQGPNTYLYLLFPSRICVVVNNKQRETTHAEK